MRTTSAEGFIFSFSIFPTFSSYLIAKGYWISMQISSTAIAEEPSTVNQTPVAGKPEQRSPVTAPEKQQIADLMPWCAKPGPFVGDGGCGGAVHYLVSSINAECCCGSPLQVNCWHYRAW